MSGIRVLSNQTLIIERSLRSADLQPLAAHTRPAASSQTKRRSHRFRALAVPGPAFTWSTDGVEIGTGSPWYDVRDRPQRFPRDAEMREVVTAATKYFLSEIRHQYLPDGIVRRCEVNSILGEFGIGEE